MRSKTATDRLNAEAPREDTVVQEVTPNLAVASRNPVGAEAQVATDAKIEAQQMARAAAIAKSMVDSENLAALEIPEEDSKKESPVERASAPDSDQSLSEDNSVRDFTVTVDNSWTKTRSVLLRLPLP